MKPDGKPLGSELTAIKGPLTLDPKV